MYASFERQKQPLSSRRAGERLVLTVCTPNSTHESAVDLRFQTSYWIKTFATANADHSEGTCEENDCHRLGTIITGMKDGPFFVL